MNLNIIAAIGMRGEIGRDGDLVWHIPEDLKRFKRLTTGHTIIMGRRTWESLPKGALPDRRNIVVTTNPSLPTPGAEKAPSLVDAVRMAADDEEVFIIGGGSIYEQALNAAHRLYLTRIEAIAEDADTFFPPVNPALWEVEEEGSGSRSRYGVPYKFVTLRKKSADREQ